MPAYYGMNQFEFQEEEDLRDYSVWIADLVHCYPPNTPLWMWARDGATIRSFNYNADRLSLPETKGWQWRVIDGMSYLAIIEARPEEVPERERKFRERIIPYMEKWDEIWPKAAKDWLAYLKPFQEFDLERATDAELFKFFRDYLIQVFDEVWMRHFEWMYPAYILFTWFRTVCGELTGVGPHDPLFKKIMAGFDNIMIKFNRELWEFGDRAKELGLDNIFLTTQNDEEVLLKLEGTEAGRKWLEEYRAWLKIRGWRCNRCEEWINNPSWIEKPSLGIPLIRQAIAKGGIFAVDMEFGRLAKEREEAEKELLAKVPEDKREWFERLMRCAQRSSVFSEDHNYYFDMMAMASLGRHVTQELGKRFVKAGATDEVDDIYFLLPDEMMKAMGRANLRPYVKQRREEWERAFKIEHKPFIGNIELAPEMARKDPIVNVIAEPPVVKPELKADLYGAASAPGVAEGVARFIPDEEHFGELQPGEILVTVATASNWTPLFNIASAVVTDAGGQLAHAVIVGREYGLPVVAGTGEATKKITTGQRIRVDGINGAVYILG